MEFQDVFKKIFGFRHDREVRKHQPLVDEINANTERLQSRSEEELKGQTDKFRGIIRERTEALEAELAESRETKRHTEDPGERDRLSRRINELEDELRRRSRQSSRRSCRRRSPR